MSHNIKNFISSFNKADLSRQCNFEVRITPPLGFFASILKYGTLNIGAIPFAVFTLANMQNITMRCEQASLPHRTFGTAHQKIYGPVEHYPIQHYYPYVTCTFICSDNMHEKMFFDLWMEYMSTSSPALLALNALGIGGARFDFEYKSNYAAAINIRQYDVGGNSQYNVFLIDAFPIAVHEMPLDWASQEINRIRVTFAYHYWTFIPL